MLRCYLRYKCTERKSANLPYLGERHLKRDERGVLDAAADRRVSLPPARQRIQTVGGATRIYRAVYGNDARHLRTNDSETPMLHDAMIIY